jgi:hypothetical protein
VAETAKVAATSDSDTIRLRLRIIAAHKVLDRIYRIHRISS